MSLSPTKYEILETMLMLEKPSRATYIAKKAGKEFPSTMMHIIGLTRLGYATTPEKGQYILTEKGKKALGIPEINKEKARKALAYLPQNQLFHFYTGLGKPLNQHAHSLKDFFDKIPKVKVESIEFHMRRGDFEAWFKGLGDLELAKKTALLKDWNMSGEELRKKLHEIVENRCIELSKIAMQIVSSESATLGV